MLPPGRSTPASVRVKAFSCAKARQGIKSNRSVAIHFFIIIPALRRILIVLHLTNERKFFIPSLANVCPMIAFPLGA